MKVVLFCGGLGLRLRDYSESIPKPMVRIGPHPLIWHVMKYYAHHGHSDFILCLGYRGDAIKEFFLHYEEAMTNDFVLTAGGDRVEVAKKDIADWTIRFVDTGQNSNIGQRLLRVREHLEGEEMFLANYSDGLTDLDLHRYLDFVRQQDKIGSFVAVRPTASFHAVDFEESGRVTGIEPIAKSTHINCGYFAFKSEIFDYIEEGEELVVEPFQRLIAKDQLVAYPYEGFWECADTFKDKMQLDAIYDAGKPPWMMWR